MRDFIRQIVLTGGMVQFPHKTGMKDWMSEAKIGRFKLRAGEQVMYYVNWSVGYQKFEDLELALDFYMRTVFTRRNLALAFVGIRFHDLCDKHLDDLSDEQLKALVKKYNDEYFAKDYPFAGKKGSSGE